MPLGLGLGLGVGKSSGPIIIGAGPLASAPAASAGNQNLYYLSTDYGLCKCVKAFKNEGVDYENLGRPSWLGSMRPGTDAFTIRQLINFADNTAAQVSFGIGSVASSPSRQFAIRRNSATGDGKLAIIVGGTYLETTFVITPSVIHNILVSIANNGPVTAFVDGSLVFTGTRTGTYTDDSRSVLIGALDSGSVATYNAESSTLLTEIYSGYTTAATVSGLSLLDRYDSNTWDGSTSGTSIMGNAYSVTKASPLTEEAFTWCPVGML